MAVMMNMMGPMCMPSMQMGMGFGHMPMGMPMGMMGPMGMQGQPMPAFSSGTSRQRPSKSRSSSNSSSYSDSSSARTKKKPVDAQPRATARPATRARPRSPVRLEEVEGFFVENGINEEAASKIRLLSPDSQRKIIARPLTGDVQNPSKVMIARVRELQAQNERKSSDNSTFMGPGADALQKFVDDHDLDESASRQLRSLPPHHQVIALRWDLSEYRNPSAKFMSLANNLSTSMRQRMPMGMWPMTGMMMGGYPQMGGCSSMDYPQGMWPAHSASGR